MEACKEIIFLMENAVQKYIIFVMKIQNSSAFSVLKNDTIAFFLYRNDVLFNIMS